MGNENIFKNGNVLAEIFPILKPIIGTLHLMAMPGAPNYKGQSMDELLDYTLDEVKDLIEAGVDGLIVENHGDIPFIKPDDFGYETVSAMTYIGAEVKKYAASHNVPIGINCLANAAIPALAIGKAVGAKFVRINQFVNAYVANEGFVEGLAGKVLRYRSNIDANEIAIFADVHVKHGSHSIVADRTISEQAKDVLFFCGDVLICTGSRTGDAPNEQDIKNIKVAPNTPVIVGSGMTDENAAKLLAIADGAIVASYLKDGGVWHHKVSRERAMRFMDCIRAIRKKNDIV
jgi:hypothetical protein